MRTKDEEKRKSLFEATVKLVNEVGFASSSVAKIAKEANVSAATLYVFHKNKEDLLVSTYLEIKSDLSKAILANFDDTLPLRDILKNVWINLFGYVSNNSEYYKYIDQFANSPFSLLVDKDVTGKYFAPLFEVLDKGIQQKIIKDVDKWVLFAFLLVPATFLANSRLCEKFETSENSVDSTFSLAWDAIKL
jgi:AcrR family transcriptional regulator